MKKRNNRLLSFIFVVVVASVVSVSCLNNVYHTHEEITNFLKTYVQQQTFYTKLYSIGKSVKGKELWVVEISAKNVSRPGTPNIKFVGNLHGNEPPGRELLLRFLEHLSMEWKAKDETITWLLENTRIHILPSLNPDGYENAIMGECEVNVGQKNANDIDLNENFPDLYQNASVTHIQPEVKAVQQWMKVTSFSLSAALYSGAVLVSYPYTTVQKFAWQQLLINLSSAKSAEEEAKFREEYSESGSKTTENLTPDNDVFVHLATKYSQSHPIMHQGSPCPQNNRSVEGGIINGAKWLPMRGTMQDYNYYAQGCLEVSIYLTCCKYQHIKKLPKIFLHNKYALVDFALEANRGVAGKIIDQDTGQPIPYASLKITDRDIDFRTNSNGEFWRILLPGSYKLEIQAFGYVKRRQPFEVRESTNRFPIQTYLVIRLRNLLSPRTSTSTETTLVYKPSVEKTVTFLVYKPTEKTVTTTSVKPTEKTVTTIKEYKQTQINGNKTSNKENSNNAANNNRINVLTSLLTIIVYFINYIN